MTLNLFSPSIARSAVWSSDPLVHIDVSLGKILNLKVVPAQWAAQGHRSFGLHTELLHCVREWSFFLLFCWSSLNRRSSLVTLDCLCWCSWCIFLLWLWERGCEKDCPRTVSHAYTHLFRTFQKVIFRLSAPKHNAHLWRFLWWYKFIISVTHT